MTSFDLIIYLLNIGPFSDWVLNELGPENSSEHLVGITELKVAVTAVYFSQKTADVQID